LAFHCGGTVQAAGFTAPEIRTSPRPGFEDLIFLSSCIVSIFEGEGVSRLALSATSKGCLSAHGGTWVEPRDHINFTGDIE